MSNLKNTFKDNPERARMAGKKSKRRPLDVQWREKLEEYGKTKDITLLDELFDILYKESKKRNLFAINTLLDRGFGKAKGSLEITGDENKPLNHSVKVSFVEAVATIDDECIKDENETIDTVDAEIEERLGLDN